MCGYCGLKCVEGGRKHWLTCPKFPEPCPNSCGVHKVERCNMEQHRSECSLEPVACEMKEFGCSVVVPRKKLARHTRESELQHLTAMTMLNLRLTRQLQQESTERDRKIENLQQEIKDLKNEHALSCDNIMEQLVSLDARIDDQGQFQVLDYRISQLETKLTEKMTQLERNVTGKIDKKSKEKSGQVSAGGATAAPVPQYGYSGSEIFTFDQYSLFKETGSTRESVPFYTHYQGYKLKLWVAYYDTRNNDIGAQLMLIRGEYDRNLEWPVKIRVLFEVINQVRDHRHVGKGATCKWAWGERDQSKIIHDCVMKYTTLERELPAVQFMKNDCLKFRITVTVVK